jgi:acylphosphatase
MTVCSHVPFLTYACVTGTVTGVIQGPEAPIQEMKRWLRETGSPKSKITDARFENERTIPSLEFRDFSIKR